MYSNTRDEYIITVSILEQVIDDYYNMILEKEVQRIRKNYNLDPESKVNSIMAFEKQVNELVSKASVEIMKMLTLRTRKCLKKRFSNNSLALLIINRIKKDAF
jgi:hypothetical protein